MANSKIIETIEEIAKSKGFSSFDVEAPELFQKGEGFLSDQYSVVVKDRNSDRELKLIIKQAFSSDVIRRIVPVKQSFFYEIFFYSTLYPAFKQLDEDCDDIAPICYAHSNEDKNEYLILEDLRDKQFRNHEKSQFISEDNIKFILKRYGKFHAYCYAIKEKNPTLVEYLLSTGDIVKDLLLGKDWMVFLFRDMVNTIKDSLDEISDKEIFDRFPDYKENAKQLIKDSLDNDTDDFMTFLHGDCWSNNLMFKLNDEEKLEDLRMIDFQLVRIGSPVCDLSYFLYSGANKSVLDNLNGLLKVYHDSLTEHATKLGCNNFIPFKELLRQWPKYSKFGLIMSLQTIKAKLQPPKDAKNLKDMEHLFENFDEGHQVTEEEYNKYNESSTGFFVYDKDEFKRRLTDIVRHMSEFKAF